MITILGVGEWSLVAWLSSAFALLQLRQEREPIDDITFRLRHPVRWTAQHPFRAVRRLFR